MRGLYSRNVYPDQNSVIEYPEGDSEFVGEHRRGEPFGGIEIHRKVDQEKDEKREKVKEIIKNIYRDALFFK